MHRIVAVALAAAVGIPVAVSAQTPDTEIHIAPLRQVDGRWQVGAPRNLTGRPGYDNQPWFTADGRAILYVSERDGQSDVFRIDLATGAAVQVTRTAEREFSPTLTADGRTLLAVRWAADMSEGHLWRYTPEGEPLGAAVGDVPRIGYYAFADPTTMAVFVNDSVQSFMLADAVSGKVEKIGEKLGGSPPKAIPGERAASFLRQAEDGTWWISRLDLATRAVTPLVKVLPGKTQYAWTPGRVLLMASGNEIRAWDPAKGGEWETIAAFDAPELADISRIAVSPAGDAIAFVATVPAAK